MGEDIGDYEVMELVGVGCCGGDGGGEMKGMRK